LKQAGRQIDPLRYIKERIQDRIYKHLEIPSAVVIVSGDFNAGYYKGEASKGAHKWLREWVGEALLANPNPSNLGELGCTFQRRGLGVSAIDHCFYTPRRGVLPALRIAVTEPAWQLSDHRPLLQDFCFSNIDMKYINKKQQRLGQRDPVAKVILGDKAQEVKYNKQLMKLAKSDLARWQKLEECERLPQVCTRHIRILEKVMVRATKAVFSVRKKRHLWSPNLVCERINRQTLIHLQRYHARSSLAPSSKRLRVHLQRCGERTLANRERRIRKVLTKQEEPEVLAKLGDMATRYLNQPKHTVRDWIQREIRVVQKHITGRVAVRERERMWKSCGKSEALRQRNHVGRMIHRVLGPKGYSYTMRSVWS
jgi:hypothetical protein